MFPNILTSDQTKLLPFVKVFASSYYLVGGTAIALQMGHRRSIDFDLFTQQQVNKDKIFQRLNQHKLDFQLKYEDGDQMTGFIGTVQFTFYEYPFSIPAPVNFDHIINMPDLLTLAAMKAYALGMRAKWKDYVDIYFIFKHHFSLDEVAQKADAIFSGGFNKKLFRQQISYFDDVNYAETIEYLQDPVDDQTIKDYLIDIATSKI